MKIIFWDNFIQIPKFHTCLILLSLLGTSMMFDRNWRYLTTSRKLASHYFRTSSSTLVSILGLILLNLYLVGLHPSIKGSLYVKTKKKELWNQNNSTIAANFWIDRDNWAIAFWIDNDAICGCRILKLLWCSFAANFWINNDALFGCWFLNRQWHSFGCQFMNRQWQSTTVKLLVADLWIGSGTVFIDDF